MNSTPRCTHCGYKFNTDDTWHSDHSVGEIDFKDGGQSDIKCPHCKKTFHVVCEHHFNFVNTDKDGEEL